MIKPRYLKPSKKPEQKRTAIESPRLVDYATVLLAATTGILALMTWLHVQKTSDMIQANQEQFMLASYPTIVITGHPMKTTSPEFEIRFKNVGDITAFNFSSMVAHLYDVDVIIKNGKKVRHDFVVNVNVLYKDGLPFEQSLETYRSDFSLFRGLEGNITGSFSIDDDHNLDTLKNTLVFTRFWVPYDKKYRYQVRTFSKDDDSAWRIMGIDDTNKLIVGFVDFKLISDAKLKRNIETFFIDFDPNELPYNQNPN